MPVSQAWSPAAPRQAWPRSAGWSRSRKGTHISERRRALARNGAAANGARRPSRSSEPQRVGHRTMMAVDGRCARSAACLFALRPRRAAAARRPGVQPRRGRAARRRQSRAGPARRRRKLSRLGPSPSSRRDRRFTSKCTSSIPTVSAAGSSICSRARRARASRSGWCTTGSAADWRPSAEPFPPAPQGRRRNPRLQSAAPRDRARMGAPQSSQAHHGGRPRGVRVGPLPRPDVGW